MLIVSPSSALVMILLHLGAGLGFLFTEARSVSSPLRRRDSNSRLFRGTDDYETDVECVIEPLTSPSYLRASHRRLVPGNGCNDNNATTSASGPEIHLVRLASPVQQVTSPRKESRGPKSVDLRIVADDSAGRKVAGGIQELVVVLVSPFPVTWRVDSQRIPRQIRVKFWVLNDSEIVRDASLSSNVRRFNPPSIEMGALSEWIGRRLGPITKTNEPQSSARSVTVSVGTRIHGTRCNEVSETKRELQGCMARWNEGVDGKDVHIIDLHSTVSADVDLTADASNALPASSSTTATHSSVLPVIEIDIHPRYRQPVESGRRRGELRSSSRQQQQRRHVILVLKLRRGAAVWKIRTNGLRGTLDIVTDQSVDTNDIDVHRVMVVTERLATLSGTELVSWTADKYGPPVSYNEVLTPANHLDLTVDGGEHLPRRKLVPQYPLRRNDVTNYGSEDHTEDEVGSVVLGRAGDNEDAQRVKSSVTRSQSLSCGSDGMVTSLNKRLLGSGLTKNQLSLMDYTCRPRENSTHFFWSTKMADCGTMRHRINGKIVHGNAIMVRIPRYDVDDADMHYDEPMEDQEFSGSGFHHIDDEDTMASDGRSSRPAWQTVVVTFSCDQSMTGEEYQLRLFDDAVYKREIQSFPATVDYKTKLYLEASSVGGGVALQMSINSCSLVLSDVISSSSTSTTVGQHDLIIRGCPSDETVRWRDDGNDVTRQRFEFTIQRYWEHQSATVTLQCQLTTCSRSANRHPGVPPCVAKEKLCLESRAQDTPGSSDGRQVAAGVVVSLGPLVIQYGNASPLTNGISGAARSTSQGVLYEDRVSPTSATSSSSSSSSSSGRCASSVVHIDGLESITVVCIAFAAFIIGILLTGAIWYIHVHTGAPRKRRTGVMRSLDASGASTPCSNAPITVHQVQRHI